MNGENPTGLADQTAVRALLIALLLWALLSFTPWSAQGPDENGYYRWISSLLFDGDWGMTHDFLQTGYHPAHILQDLQDITATGNHPNAFSLGPALLWSLALVPWVGVEWLTHGAAWWNQVDPFAWRYRVLISLVTFLIGAHGVVLLYHTLRHFFSARVSFAASAITALGSPLTFYLTLNPAMSHAHSLWACTVLWWLTLRLWREGPRRPGLADAALGMAVGLLALMRWQAVLWAALPATVYLTQMIRRPHRGWALGGALVATLASLLVFSPQLVAWKILYGSWLVIPQGQGFLFGPGQSLALTEVLLSRWNGLITCHPWTALALVGLLLWARRAPALFLGAAVMLAGTWLVNAGVHDWWAGDSFGARRWSHVLPVFAIGIASLFDAIPAGLPRRVIAGGFTAVIIALNLLMAILWTRGVIHEDWWGHLPMASEIVSPVLGHPHRWIPGLVGSLVISHPRHPFIAIGFGAIFLGLVGVLALASHGGRSPWPRGRRASVLTIGFACCASVVLAVSLWASGRSPHPQCHLALRDALRSGVERPGQWRLIGSDRFEIDETCPAHLAVAGQLALLNGAPDRGLAHLARLEQTHPRLARLLILEHADDPQVRREALARIADAPRWGDGIEFGLAMAHAVDLRERGVLEQLLLMPTADPVTSTAAGADLAHLDQRWEEEERLLRINHLRQPHDPWIMIRLAELAERRSDPAEASRLRQLALRWCEVKTASFERLQPHNPIWLALLKGEAISNWGRAWLTLLDPLEQTEAYAEVLARIDRLLLRAGRWKEFQRFLLYDLLDAARRCEDPQIAERLLWWFDSLTEEQPNSLERWLALIEVQGLLGSFSEAFESLEEAMTRFPEESAWDQVVLRASTHLTLEDLRGFDLDRVPPQVRGSIAMGLAFRAGELGEPAVALEWTHRARRAGLTGERLELTAHHFLLLTDQAHRETGSELERDRLRALIESHAALFPEDVDTQPILERLAQGRAP